MGRNANVRLIVAFDSDTSLLEDLPDWKDRAILPMWNFWTASKQFAEDRSQGEFYIRMSHTGTAVLKRWCEFDAAASEGEMGDLLYGLVRMLKPVLVFESGCYLGHATRCLAQAVKHNVYGRVVSCDVDSDKVRKTQEALRDHANVDRDLSAVVEVREGRAIAQPELKEADFVFCDSRYDDRAEEIHAVKSGCIVVVHDTTEESWRQYTSATMPKLGPLVQSFGGLLFEVSRGFGILIKP